MVGSLAGAYDGKRFVGYFALLIGIADFCRTALPNFSAHEMIEKNVAHKLFDATVR